MGICDTISEKVQGGRAKEVVALINQALEEGIAPDTILTEGLITGMNIIGQKFKNNEVFVPEILVAARDEQRTSDPQTSPRKRRH